MRIVFVILSTAALLFIGGMILLFWKNWWNIFWNQNPSQNIPTSSSIVPSSGVDGMTIETIKYQVKTEEKLNALEKKLDMLAWANTPSQSQNTTTTGSEVSSSGGIVTVPISVKFLSKILPTIEPVKVENSGIFDLRTFDNTPYTTYQDTKFWMKVIASMVPYQTFLKNFQALDQKVYTVNISKAFPFQSFYVNPPKSDSTVRIVMEVEAQTLLISLPKSKFQTFKELILKTK